MLLAFWAMSIGQSVTMELSVALEYAARYWPYATGALNDGRLPLDNNLAERGIKPFDIGRNYVPRRPPACIRSWSRPRQTA